MRLRCALAGLFFSFLPPSLGSPTTSPTSVPTSVPTSSPTTSGLIDLHVGTLVPWVGWAVGPNFASAPLVAAAEINANPDILPGYRLQIASGDDQCAAATAMEAVFNLKTNHHLDVIIGPPCSVGCEPVSLLATLWEVPLVSWGCAASILSNKDVHPNFVRTVTPFTKIAPALLAMFRYYGWHKGGLITSTESLWAATATSIEKTFAGAEIPLQIRSIENGGVGTPPGRWEDMLQKFKTQKEVRVILVVAYPGDQRDLMLTAHKLGMTGAGYVWILATSTNNFCQAETTWMEDSENDATCVEATVGHFDWGPAGGRGQLYEEFLDKIVAGQSRFFNITLTAQVNAYAEALYSAVYLYAHAMTSVIAAGGDPKVRDAPRDMAALKATTFQGPLGLVQLDEFGDRDSSWDFRHYARDSTDDTMMELTPVSGYSAVNKTYHVDTDFVWAGGLTTPPSTIIPSTVWTASLTSVVFAGAVLFCAAVLVILSTILFILSPNLSHQPAFLVVMFLLGLVCAAGPSIAGTVGILSFPCPLAITLVILILPLLAIPVIIHSRILLILTLLVRRARQHTPVENFEYHKLLQLKSHLSLGHTILYTVPLIGPCLIGLLVVARTSETWRSPTTPRGCIDTGTTVCVACEFVYLGAFLAYYVYRIRNVRDTFFMAREHLVFLVMFLSMGFLFLLLAFLGVNGQDGLDPGLILTFLSLLVGVRRGVIVPLKGIYGTAKHSVSNADVASFVLEDALYTRQGFQYFLCHCIREFNQENILCWRAIEDLMHHSSVEKFLELWNYFISPDSFLEVNISDEAFQQFRHVVVEVKASNRLGDVIPMQATLKQVQMELLAAMKKDILPRFMRTELCAKFLRKEPFDGAGEGMLSTSIHSLNSNSSNAATPLAGFTLKSKPSLSSISHPRRYQPKRSIRLESMSQRVQVVTDTDGEPSSKKIHRLGGTSPDLMSKSSRDSTDTVAEQGECNDECTAT